MQAQDLINLAAFDARVLAAGDSLEPAESADCLTKLNQLISLWDTEYLNIFCVQEAVYAVTGSRASPYAPYAIGQGAGADFVAPRPVSIRAANIISSGFTFALEILTVAQWARIIEKSVVGDPPEGLYYDGNYPNGSLYLNPWPASNGMLELFTWEQLGQFGEPPGGLTTTFDMPPGYAEALEWNLAISIAEMFGRPVTQSLLNKAAAAKASIRANNAPPGPGNAEVVQASGTAVPIPPDAGNAMTR